MILLVWLSCGLISFITVVLVSDRGIIRNSEFIDSVMFTFLLVVLLIAGPIGLVFLFASAVVHKLLRLF